MRITDVNWFFHSVELIRYTIPKNIKKVPVKDWDKQYSTELFFQSLLKKENISDIAVEKCLCSNDIYTECMNYFDMEYRTITRQQSEDYYFYGIKNRLLHEIKIMTIFQKEPEEIIRRYFLLLAYSIVEFLFPLINGNLDEEKEYVIKNYLDSLIYNRIEDKSVSVEESCFLFACQNWETDLDYICRWNMMYVLREDNVYLNSIIDNLGFSCLEKLIYKKLENTFSKKINLNSLLLTEKKKKQTQEKVKEIVFRYDFKKMKKQSNYYILDGQGKERETATQDILSLNEIFQHSCCKDLGLYIEVKNIVFETKEVVFASIGEYMEYTSDLSGIRIQYMPYTKTGKLAKYPYWLYFIAENVQKSNNEKVTMFGSIYYLQNGAVGKVGIRFNIKDFYVTINKNDKGEIKCNRVRIEGSKF